MANGSVDPAAVRVDIPLAPGEPRATLLAPLAEPRPVPLVTAGSRVSVDHELSHRGWLVLDWE